MPAALAEGGEDRPQAGPLDRPEPSFVARLNDLPESGLRLRLSGEQDPYLPLGAEVELVVSLPETNEQVRARVVHRDEPGARGSVVVGLAFLDQNRASADRIRRHVLAVQREMLARRRARAASLSRRLHTTPDLFPSDSESATGRRCPSAVRQVARRTPTTPSERLAEAPSAPTPGSCPTAQGILGSAMPPESARTPDPLPDLPDTALPTDRSGFGLDEAGRPTPPAPVGTRPTSRARVRAAGKWTRAGRPQQPLALVLGGYDVVRPLVEAGVPVAAWADPADPVHRARGLAVRRPPWASPLLDPDAAVKSIMSLARSLPRPPVLLAPNDHALALLSRRRRELEASCVTVLPGPDLVDDLLDKGRFRTLAARLRLPVPASTVFRPAPDQSPEIGLPFPVVVKPLRRGGAWQPADHDAKAVAVTDPAHLRELWPRWAELGDELLAQEMVPGGEHRIESYHVYVDRGGRTRGEFTGRKIRTLPIAFGESTAVEITQVEDVLQTGRRVVDALQLRGVAKVDFKRAPDGTLRLLEVNPRFNLWHHPGARAGVNLPALAYADAIGAPLPAPARVRPGVTWCDPLLDQRASRLYGLSRGNWARWALTCDTYSGFSATDPLPLLLGRVVPALLLRQRSAGGGASAARGQRDRRRGNA